MKITSLVGACLLGALSMLAAAGQAAPAPRDFVSEAVLAVDEVGRTAGLSPAADLLSVELGVSRATGQALLRFSFLALADQVPGALGQAFGAADASDGIAIQVQAARKGETPVTLAAFPLVRAGSVYGVDLAARTGSAALSTDPADPDALYLTLPADLGGAWELSIRTAQADGRQDEVLASYPPSRDYQAHCALVLHGNQGIGYTDVLHGRGDDLEGSGFDEALQVHESTGVPGNFHLSGTLMTAAEWAARNGDPVDFNAWLAAGVTAGWAGMVTSAYGQHMMPFVTDAMNSWSVATQAAMVENFYGYTPRVAWVPERVWLNTSGYPSSGVNDWIGDNWQSHGVQGVILDDDVHLQGHDNHRIHTLAANGLRLVPRDRSFTGNIIGGNGQGSLDILTGLAGSGVGQYRIAVFAEDWEAASEMGGWASITPSAKETYDWFVGKCATESSWLHTWKLADALANPDFTGDTMDLTPGTYNEIGGTGGYGGSDNSWYTHWAGFIPYANGGDGSGNCGGTGGNCKDYGTLWSEAYNALMAAPDNNLSQAGWYVLMTNLHETAWHDYLGGPISGWQHKYSSHIKNAMIYAEAAHWAAGQYAQTTSAYFSDIDNDGYQEAVLHNDHLFGVLEGTGGRLTHLFVKGPGYDDTAIGVDNAYWADTDGDFNDANHVGAFSEVSPDYQHQGYVTALDLGAGTVAVTCVLNEVEKTIRLTEGDSFFDVTYRVGPVTHWVQGGFSPSLVDLVWNGDLERVWAPDASYMGFRNPNTGLGAAWILGAGGAQHQKEISGTLMRGDEIKGSNVFQLQLFAGPVAAPDGGGDVAELRALADLLTDSAGPRVTASSYYPSTLQWAVSFDQPTLLMDETGFTVLGQFGQVTLPVGTTVLESGATLTKTFLLDAGTAAAVAALTADGDIYPALETAAAADEQGNGVDVPADPFLVVIDVVTAAIAIDGNLQAPEWEQAQALADSSDSQWTASNEIDRLLARWDETYLYLAIDGQVTGNSWLLYLDVDPDGPGGQTDLTAIDAWERGATFTAPGFAPDFQYGCYQHQSIHDGDGFWQLLSPTATQDRSGEIVSAFDSFHAFGENSGSELAIPWQTLYGLGAGNVPSGARIALVAAVCWDPEPGGQLGGDSAPSNLAASLPAVDSAWVLSVDADGDGHPDGSGASPVPTAGPVLARLLPNVPNPFNPQTSIRYEIGGSGPAEIDLSIYDVRGRLVNTLVRGMVEPGAHQAVWDGRTGNGRPVAAGTYFTRLVSRGRVATRPLTLVK